MPVNPEDHRRPMSPTDQLSSCVMYGCASIGLLVGLVILVIIALCIKGALAY
jgi:hypothetical protein